MSNIAIHDLSARARARLGRKLQIEALPPQLDRHEGDHWQLNRAGMLVPRKPRNDPANYQPWPIAAENNITLAVRGAVSSTTTSSTRIPFACVIREISYSLIAGTAGGTQSADVVVVGHGSVWRSSTDSPQLVGSTNANDWNITYDPHFIVPHVGVEITASIVCGAAADGYLTIRIQPLAQFLRGGG